MNLVIQVSPCNPDTPDGCNLTLPLWMRDRGDDFFYSMWMKRVRLDFEGDLEMVHV